MKWPVIQALLGHLEWFDLATAQQATQEKRTSLLMQLSRWTREGKLLSPKRGMYLFADPYRRAPLSVPKLANHIYAPSYLSGAWCLGFYGLIPEMVPLYTSITTRVTRTFHSALGAFHYAKVKPSLFFGFSPRRIQDSDALLAGPEKALCDFLYIEKGEWTESRLEEMRFQNLDTLDSGVLQERMLPRFPVRVRQAVRVMVNLTTDEHAGTKRI